MKLDKETQNVIIDDKFNSEHCIGPPTSEIAYYNLIR
jgi:hypothetical protein